MQIRRHISSNFHGISPFLPRHFKTVHATKARSIIIGILINKRTKRTKEQIFEHSYSGTIEKNFLEIWMFVRNKINSNTQTHETKQQNRQSNDFCDHFAAVFCSPSVKKISKWMDRNIVISFFFCWILNATKVLLVIYVHE